MTDYSTPRWYTHIRTGGLYMIGMMNPIHLKHPSTGLWVNGVLYFKSGNLYVREQQDFHKKFRPSTEAEIAEMNKNEG